MRHIILVVFILIGSLVKGQVLNNGLYDTDQLSKEFHRGRRDALRSRMMDHSIAILFSGPERNRSGDDDFQYHQNPDFYYLTGLTESNALLLIFKDLQNLAGVNTDECLFVQARDPLKESWTGRRFGVEGAKEKLGFLAVFTDETFDSLHIPFKNFTTVYYKSLPKGVVDDRSEGADLFDLIEQFKKKCSYPPDNGDSYKLFAWLSEMRMVKQPEEMALIRKAIGMSCDAHIEMMKALEPGMTEYQVQAIGEYVFKKNGSEYVGYPSICGGGENSCILHYENNRRKLEAKDILLLDMGAEYHGYSADITRTIPVSGKFSDEQKAIYQVVYNAQEAALAACKPGNDFMAPHRAATDVIKQGLLELGIIKDKKDFSKYFTHNTSHYLGLDVHDVGNHGVLMSGNIITVEPGIYIPEGSPCNPIWWNIGIRLEDDILISENGYENLSVKAPRSVEQVEELMKKKSFFNQDR